MSDGAGEAVDTALREAAIRAGLKTRRIACAIHLFREVDSTNNEAATLAASGAADGTVVIAESQRVGRGRMGRRWASPGMLGLYCSLVLRPPLSPREVSIVTLLGAVAAAEAIEQVCPLAVAVKWPNDLIVHGRKVGGVLGEMAVEGVRLHHVILGIGINVNQTESDFDEELRLSASSLRIETAAPVGRIALVRSLCESLDRWYDRCVSEGATPIMHEVRRRCMTLGQAVAVRSGDQTLSGLAVGLERDGALVIRDAEGRLHPVWAGEVVLAG